MKARTLSFIALGGALVSAGCISGAYKMANTNDSGKTEVITRQIPWDGSRSLVLGVPAAVRYVQGEPAGITARGQHRSVSTLEVSGGFVKDKLLHTGEPLELEIRAPAISHFELNGRSTLRIEGYDQDSLSVTTQGAATVAVDGRARQVNVSMQGRSDVNLARLNVENLDGKVGGAGTLVAAPTRVANLEVRNVASAVLLSRPVELNMKLIDEGRVIDAAGAR
jgi:hypothetical protein